MIEYKIGDDMKKPIVLCILDGVGIRQSKHGNAVSIASMPNFDNLAKTYPHSLLEACGENVGLPDGQMGNSEVGHTNIGAGRIVYQPLQLINEKIKNKTFFENKNILEVINHAKENNSKLHIMGLLSDGGIHSHIDHLFSIIDMCKKEGIQNLYIHAFLDGRDTLPSVSMEFLNKLQRKLQESQIGKIATISGRYYAMDRDNRWDRIKESYDVIVNNIGDKYPSFEEAIQKNYDNDITDEFIKPCIINENGFVDNNDGIIVFNYRPDRLRELFKAITNKEFNEFKTKKLENIKLVTMFLVSEEVICKNAFEHQKLNNIFGEYISKKGFKQLRIAETEKYAHVTYFFDGGKEIELKGCKRILIPSPKVATYDLKPEMSAIEITDKLLEEIDNYDVVILNYANGDMVGHTGNLKATVLALETLDKCLGKLYNKVNELNGTLVITADHGNSDYMLDDNDNIITSHSMSKVPFIITNNKYELKNGKLSDIAPTILYMLNLKKPKEMTGENLITNIKKKRKISINKIFIILSLLFIFSLLLTYTVRCIHFYRIEHPKATINSTKYLYSKIIEENEVASSSNGLYRTNKKYVFKGKVNNNYIKYSNRLWRIISINDDNTIKMITEDNQSSLVWNYESNDYKTSYIRKWLNKDGVFYNSLNDPDNYLEEKQFCIDNITSKNDKKCKKKINDSVGLLTYKEYKDAYAYNSYLNIGKYFWLANSNNKGIWYVFNEGGINYNSYSGNIYYSYGVRPIINLKSNIEFISGDGTKENPYIIEKENKLNSGSYVKYSDYMWKVVTKNDQTIKLVMTNPIEVNKAYVTKSYSKKDSNFNKNNYYSVAYYLNNVFYKSLKNRNSIVNSTWSIGQYNSETNYNYENLSSSTVEANVGLLNVSELYTTDIPTLTLTPESDDTIYVTKENGNLYAEDIETELTIRPVINIKNNVNIESGSGTESDPYIVKE